MENCIFCQIVKKERHAHIFWEDDEHMAFLSPFPNTEGFTVVITKEHHSSYLFDLDTNIYTRLALAAKEVGHVIDQKLPVKRTGLIMEGMGIDHAHIKLFPMHGIPDGSWQPVKSTLRKYFDKYEGYISSHDGYSADEDQLVITCKKLKK